MKYIFNKIKLFIKTHIVDFIDDDDDIEFSDKFR